jgi:hypothetical protein
MSKLVKKGNLLKKRDMKKLAAVELMASDPDITGKEISDLIDINQNTLVEWKKDPAFVEAVYEKYQTKFNLHLVELQEALIREGKEGNVQAIKLAFEIANKIVKRVSVNIQAPFQQWLDAKDADIIDVDEEIPNVGYTPKEILDTIVVNESRLPKRNKANDKPIKRMRKEKNRIEDIKKNHKKIKKRKEQYNSWYHIRARAKKVGLPPLPPGKPTKTQRADWLNELKRLEKEKKVKRKNRK